MKTGDLAKIKNCFEDENVPVPVFTKNPVTEKIDPSLDAMALKPGIIVMVLDVNSEILESQIFDDSGNVTEVCIEFTKALYCENGEVFEVWIWKEELEKLELLK